MKLSKVSPEKAMLENLTSAVTVSNIVVRTVRNLSTCKTASNHSMQKSKGGRENVQHSEITLMRANKLFLPLFILLAGFIFMTNTAQSIAWFLLLWNFCEANRALLP